MGNPGRSSSDDGGARRKLLIRGACGLALVLALCSALDTEGFRRSVKLQKDIAALKARNDVLRDQNASLAEQIRALRKDPDAQERAAREELGYVKPGEIVINLE